MDNLDTVLAGACRCLKPGGRMLCSVATDNFVNWLLLPKILTDLGHSWHLNTQSGGELGEIINSSLTAFSKIPASFRHILRGLMEMEDKPQECSGAVFLLKKTG